MSTSVISIVVFASSSVSVWVCRITNVKQLLKSRNLHSKVKWYRTVSIATVSICFLKFKGAVKIMAKDLVRTRAQIAKVNF